MIIGLLHITEVPSQLSLSRLLLILLSLPIIRAASRLTTSRKWHVVPLSVFLQEKSYVDLLAPVRVNSTNPSVISLFMKTTYWATTAGSKVISSFTAAPAARASFAAFSSLK